MNVDKVTYFVCKICGQNWSPKTPCTGSDFCDVERTILIMEEKTPHKKPVTVDCNNVDMTYERLLVTPRICNSCKVYKHRLSLKNPFLVQLTTGSMPDYIRNLKQNDQNSIYAITYAHFWISEYCIRTNCLKKAQLYGFCKTCFTVCKADPSLLTTDMDMNTNFESTYT